MTAISTQPAEYQQLLLRPGEAADSRTRVAVVTTDQEIASEISACLLMFHHVVLVDAEGGAMRDKASAERGVHVFVSTFAEVEAAGRPGALPLFPDARLVVLGPPPDGIALVCAARRGAWAYFGLDDPRQELGVVLQRVRLGACPLLEVISNHPAAAESTLHLLANGTAHAAAGGVDGPEANPLTQREANILSAVADGAKSGDIADQLGLSAQTVRNQMTLVLQKMGARTRGQAAAVALRNGWLDGAP